MAMSERRPQILSRILPYHPSLELLEVRTVPSGSWLSAPVIPTIDASMQSHLQAVLALGNTLGNRADVFSRVGDSITAAPSFLNALGNASYNPTNPALVGTHLDLAGTIGFYQADPVDPAKNNSFGHTSWAATAGWRTIDVLDGYHSYDSDRDGIALPDETPLQTEFRLTHPSVALIMLGTNDVGFMEPPAQFRQELTDVGLTALQDGVIPVFSSIPDYPRLGPTVAALVPQYNQVIGEVAAALNVPFWNYWLALQPLPNKGLSADLVHPSADPGGSALFTQAGLSYGFNVRNLTAVQVLDKIRRVAINGEASDSSNNISVSANVAQFVDQLYRAALARPASPAELQSWGGMIQGGVSRGDVVNAVWHSAEHFGQEVFQLYNSLLRRHPSDSERVYWSSQLSAGIPETAVLQGFLTSEEYWNAHPNPGALINGFYQDVLKRKPVQGEDGYWLGLYYSGIGLPTLARAFVGSTEALGQMVQNDYLAFLGRPAVASDLQFWVNALVRGQLSPSTLGQDILTSDEFALHGI